MDFNIADLELIISDSLIAQKIKEAANKLDQEYQDKQLLIVMILKGSLFLTADLMRELKTQTSLAAISCSSYGLRGTKRGALIISGLEKIEVKDKNILLVDDIFDSGNTLSQVVLALQSQQPASIKTLVLLRKKRDRMTTFNPDIALFEIEDKFVVGYGMDYKEYYRGLKGIYTLPAL